jgi:hypothetical protein
LLHFTTGGTACKPIEHRHRRVTVTERTAQAEHKTSNRRKRVTVKVADVDCLSEANWRMVRLTHLPSTLSDLCRPCANQPQIIPQLCIAGLREPAMPGTT